MGFKILCKLNHFRIILHLSKPEIIAEYQNGFPIAFQMLQATDFNQYFEFFGQKGIHSGNIFHFYHKILREIRVYFIVNIFVFRNWKESIQKPLFSLW